MAVIYCPSCGHENDASARFCENCGRSLSDVAAADAAVRPPQADRDRVGGGTTSQSAGAAPTGMPSGARSGTQAERLLDDDGQPLDNDAEVLLWNGRPSKLWSPRLALLNRYRLTNQRLRWEHGFIGRQIDEVDLFRVNDVGVEQSAIQRLQGVGNVTVYMADASTYDKILQNIGNPDGVKDLIRRAVRRERQRRRVMIREDMYDRDDDLLL